jgi:hypothetical protein
MGGYGIANKMTRIRALMRRIASDQLWAEVRQMLLFSVVLGTVITGVIEYRAVEPFAVISILCSTIFPRSRANYALCSPEKAAFSAPRSFKLIRCPGKKRATL